MKSEVPKRDREAKKREVAQRHEMKKRYRETRTKKLAVQLENPKDDKVRKETGNQKEEDHDHDDAPKVSFGPRSLYGVPKESAVPL